MLAMIHTGSFEHIKYDVVIHVALDPQDLIRAAGGS